MNAQTMLVVVGGILLSVDLSELALTNAQIFSQDDDEYIGANGLEDEVGCAAAANCFDAVARMKI